MGGTSRQDIVSYFPITFLLALIVLLYSVYAVTVIPEQFRDTNPAKDALYPNSDLVNLIVINVFFVLLLVSFLLASVVQPGKVPGIWPWNPACPDPRGDPAYDGGDLDSSLLLRGYEKKAKNGKTRFCKWCGNFKPDRTHHSSMTGECVLEMDHYCPWVRNCIGYFNKKYFFLLIFYGSICLITYCIALGSYFVHACREMKSALQFFIVFSWLLSLMLGTATTTFTCFHVFLMSKSYTTIEYCEKKNADDQARTFNGVKIKDLYRRSPYDLGTYENWKHMLGPYPWLWLVPTRAGMPNLKTNPYAGALFKVSMKHQLVRETSSRQQDLRKRTLGVGPADGDVQERLV